MRISEQERPELSPQRIKDINNRITVLEIDKPNVAPERRMVIARNWELIKSQDTFVGALMDEKEAANPISSWWMPSNFLPDLGTEEGRMVELPHLQAEMKAYSDAEIAVQVLISLTEDGLPLFMSALAAETAIDGSDLQTGWGRWTHWWTAQENRHGGLITPQLMYSGRIDPVAYERMRTAYLRNGMKMGTDDAVEFDVFTELQEDGTQTPHRRTSRIAKKRGAVRFAKGLAEVAGEEGEHKIFYRQVAVKAAMDDPDAVIVATHRMVKKGVNMPGARITEGEVLDPDRVESGLFGDLKLAAEKTGVYTMRDYLGVVVNLVEALDVRNRTDLRTSEGRQAQDRLARYDREYQDKIGGRFSEMAKNKPMPVFSFVKPQEPEQKFVVFEKTQHDRPLHNTTGKFKRANQ